MAWPERGIIVLYNVRVHADTKRKILVCTFKYILEFTDYTRKLYFFPGFKCHD